MEVSGRRPSADRNKVSSDDSDIYCQPCDKKGKRLPVHGFCQTCGEYLCNTCYKAHTIPTPLQHHVLLDKSSMPKSVSSVKQKTQISNCTIVCKTHPGKVIEFFCPKHKAVVCGVCAVLTHKPCKVNFIPDIAHGYQTGPEYGNLKDEILQLEGKIDACLNKATTNSTTARESNGNAIEYIKKFRTEICAYLDKKEKYLLKEAQKFQTDDDDLFKTQQTECVSMKAKLAQMKSNLSKFEKESSDLFVTAKQILSNIPDFESQLDQCETKSNVSSYNFQPEQATEQILSSKCPLGKLVKVNKQQEVKRFHATTSQSHVNLATAKTSKLPGINIRTANDKDMHSCWITGAILLSPTRLLLADFSGASKSVKDVDLTNNTITSCLQLSSDPYDITALPKQQTAVTLPFKSHIQVISTSGGLSPAHTISVSGKCYGINSTPDKLCVSYLSPGKVEVMDHHGGVLQSIISDVHSKPLFKTPCYLAVTSEDHQEVMYVSDRDTNTITKLTLQGEVLYTYRDKDLSGPRGITVTDNGDLVICNKGNHNVHLITGRTGEKIRTLINKEDGIEQPYSVCYCPVQNKLYVGLDSKDNLQVFKLT